MNQDKRVADVLRTQAHVSSEDVRAMRAAIERGVADKRRRQHQTAFLVSIAAVAGIGLGTPLLISTLPTDSSTSTLAATDSAGSDERSSVVPVQPSAPPTAAESDRVADLVQGFSDAGYSFDDAVALAGFWRQDASGVYLVKALAGQQLEDDIKLPIAPGQDIRGSQTISQSQLAQSAWTDAGYDRQDAIELAALWNTERVELVPVIAGQQLRNGRPVPGLEPLDPARRG